MKKPIFYILIALAVLGLAWAFWSKKTTAPRNPKQENQDSAVDIPARPVTDPLDRAAERVTKKPFGIKISPQSSPVQPEKFSGYHTGVDFETFADEQDVNVPVRAICLGKLLVVERATGYGGVAVQKCAVAGENVTVIYGHLRLTSISKKAGDDLAAGEQFAVLGTGYSAETDGERRHLHLGIHKGTAINIRGYAQSEGELKDWIDILLLKL